MLNGRTQMAWLHRVKIKHLLTEDEDHESVQKAMNAIADVLRKTSCFWCFFDLPKFRAIPQGDDFFGPTDYANKLLDRMYDFTDAWRIWLE